MEGLFETRVFLPDFHDQPSRWKEACKYHFLWGICTLQLGPQLKKRANLRTRPRLGPHIAGDVPESVSNVGTHN